jgi:nucleotide-binding universal stress UspA family protein
MTVVLTTDGSDRSWTALPHAHALATALGQPLKVLRVLHPMLDVADEFGPSIADASRRVSERWTEEIAVGLRAMAVEAEPVVAIVERRESVQQAIVRNARDLGASVVAMNSRGAGLLHHAAIGSTAMAMVGDAGCPVMLVGPAVVVPAGQGPYRAVITNDGSRDSDTSIPAFATLFSGANVDVVLTSVYERAIGDAEREREMGDLRTHLETFRDQFSVGGSVQTRVMAATGFASTAHAIARAGEELEASIIAMGSHGHSVVRHLFAGSTTLGVLKQSRLPVLVVAV